jgi:membrane protein DedA with SNARE-associated domain
MLLHLANLAADPGIVDRLVRFIAAHRAWVLPVVFIVGLLKSLPLVTAFVPSTAMFAGMAAAYSVSGGTFVPLWLAAAFGATAGDAMCYAAGRIYRHDIVKTWPLSKTPDLMERGQSLFERWGVASVLGAKFVFGVRPFIPIIAGMYRLPVPIFLTATNLSSLVWAAIGMGAGFGLVRLWG